MKNAYSIMFRFYKDIAIILLNALILFIVINVLLGFLYMIKDTRLECKRNYIKSCSAALFSADGALIDNGNYSSWQLKRFDYNAYGRYAPDYVAKVLQEFYNLEMSKVMYQPWVQFSDRLYSGENVNIELDNLGFPMRRTENPMNVLAYPCINIFVFGGSTTMGWNVSDNDTWPSYLSKVLNNKANELGLKIHVEVTNYGRSYYNTSQEIILLIDLLKSGYRPSLVIFMDGVNWGIEQDVPEYTAEFIDRFAMAQGQNNGTKTIASLASKLPVVRAMNSKTVARILKWLKINRKNKEQAEREKGNLKYRGIDFNNEETVKRYLNRFDQNREIAKLVCQFYDIDYLFFAQPDPQYNYPYELYHQRIPEDMELSRCRKGRAMFYNQMEEKKDVIYMGDLFKQWGKPAIIDGIHYSPDFSHFIAKEVAKYINLNELTVRPAVDYASSTMLPNTTRHYISRDLDWEIK